MTESSRLLCLLLDPPGFPAIKGDFVGKDKIQEILNNFARATEVRPPCEARIDPDTCIACTEWTTESLEAGARLWGQARAPETIKALAAEVLRLRAERDDLQAQVLRHHIMRNRLRSCVSDTNVTRAWDRMRSLTLRDVEADGVSGEGADRHRK